MHRCSQALARHRCGTLLVCQLSTEVDGGERQGRAQTAVPIFPVVYAIANAKLALDACFGIELVNLKG